MESLSSKKILILHTSIGLGHKFIAENIAYHLSESGCEVRVEDILEVQKGRLVEFSTELHKWINQNAPWIWSFLYHLTNLNLVSKLTLGLRLWVASKNSQKTLQLIENFQPDLVVSVHATASGVVAYLKKKNLYKGKFAIGFSDFHLHKFWLYPNADFYLANIQEQKNEMVKIGYNADKIFVCGITLKPKLDLNNTEIKQRLKILSEEKVILFSSGSLGTGLSQELLKNILNLEKVKIIVVCGKNISELENLNLKFKTEKILFFGFYSPMQELYSIADIFLTKPGGLSVAEALQYNLPIQITHLLAGQEELNYKYLVEKKLVLEKKGDVLETVVKEIQSNEFKKSLTFNLNKQEILNSFGEVKRAVFEYLK
jgi:processive 1,2-diacylglycerol beta-glucosyltransferase